MFRNQYDTDVTVWSPQGRLWQVEYAMHAVKQGSACVGIRSDKHVVLAAVKRSASELASYQEKVFRIDDHMGMAIAGLTADARVLARYMQTECLNHKYTFESEMVVGRLVEAVADKHQRCTQSYVRRPYGVGLLIGGYDRTGPHLYETSPSGCYYEYEAMAIGSRSNSAKTYLQREYKKLGDSGFNGLSAEELILHAVRSLQGCLPGEKKLSVDNLSLSIVGGGRKFEIISGEALLGYLKLAITEEEDASAAKADDDDDDDDE